MYPLLNDLETLFYFLQQNLSQIISYELNHFKIYIFILLFFSGIFTSINPCLISIIPISILYMIESKNKSGFILGLLSSIISVIILALIVYNYYHKLINNIPILSSLLMIIIGLNLLNILQFQNIYLNTNDLYKTKFYLIFKNYITGFIIGLSSSTCSTPILINILFWISYSNNLLLGITYICFYLTGYIFPLLFLINISISSMKLHIINKMWNYFIPFNGSIILSIGIFSLLNIFFT